LFVNIPIRVDDPVWNDSVLKIRSGLAKVLGSAWRLDVLFVESAVPPAARKGAPATAGPQSLPLQARTGTGLGV